MVGFTKLLLLIKTIDQKNTTDLINPNFCINTTIILDSQLFNSSYFLG